MRLSIVIFDVWLIYESLFKFNFRHANIFHLYNLLCTFVYINSHKYVTLGGDLGTKRRTAIY